MEENFLNPNYSQLIRNKAYKMGPPKIAWDPSPLKNNAGPFLMAHFNVFIMYLIIASFSLKQITIILEKCYIFLKNSKLLRQKWGSLFIKFINFI